MTTEPTTAAPPGRKGDPVLSVRNLDIDFWVDGTWYPAVIGAEFDLYPGEVLAIVGESGSGKSTTAMAMLGLLPKNASVRGSIKLRGKEIVGIDRYSLRQIRGAEAAMIFQEPMTALNPVYTIGFQIAEMMRSHQAMSPKLARDRAIELLNLVEIPDAERRVDAYPHQLSGGQRQRAMIAQALAMDPALLVADEPTTALDVTVQAEILKLMRDLRDRIDAGVVLITHDMGVVADLSDRVLVMQRGKIVEGGTSSEVFYSPTHEYTQQLLAAVPHLGSIISAAAEQMATIHVDEPEPIEPGHLAPGWLAAGRRPRGRRHRVPQARPGPGVPGRRRCLVDGRARRGRRSGGGVRFGQDHHRSGDRRPAAVRRGQGCDPRHEHGRHRQGEVAPDPARREFRVPGPRLVAQPAVADRGVDRRAAAAAEDRQRATTSTSASRSSSIGCTWRGTCGTGTPTSSLAGSANVSASHGALALGPKLLIADEPTSALDVSVQARVLDLFQELQREIGFACLFISHDLAVVEILSRRIAVMQLGKLVEFDSREQILTNPQDPYTQRLLAAVPVPDPDEQRERRIERDALLQQAADEAAADAAAVSA